jgi:hypothetical protein
LDVTTNGTVHVLDRKSVSAFNRSSLVPEQQEFLRKLDLNLVPAKEGKSKVVMINRGVGKVRVIIDGIGFSATNLVLNSGETREWSAEWGKYRCRFSPLYFNVPAQMPFKDYNPHGDVNWSALLGDRVGLIIPSFIVNRDQFWIIWSYGMSKDDPEERPWICSRIPPSGLPAR